MKKIGFSGTLDPITNGHMWVIGEARSIADEVIVFLSENSTKQPRFSAEERRAIVLESCAERQWDNVQVLVVKSDYTARVARKHGVDYLIRGIRTTADFDYENLIQQTNVDVLQGAKTIFVMPPRDLGSVSSSFVKALEGPIGWNWIMKKFVPGPAYHAWVLSWLRKEWETLWDYAHADVPAIAHADQWFVRLTGARASYAGEEAETVTAVTRTRRSTLSALEALASGTPVIGTDAEKIFACWLHVSCSGLTRWKPSRRLAQSHTSQPA